ATLDKLTICVIHKGQSTAHTCSEVPTCRSEDQHGSAGHVLTTVIANPFHYSYGTRIAHCKTLPCLACCKQRPTCRSVQAGITHQDVFVPLEDFALAWAHYDLTTAH